MILEAFAGINQIVLNGRKTKSLTTDAKINE